LLLPAFYEAAVCLYANTRIMSSHTHLLIGCAMSDFSRISSRNELADFLAIPRKMLTYILYVRKVENLYQSFEIPKKNGETRKIDAPTYALKDIQKRLTNALWNHQQEIWEQASIHPCMSHAFEPGKSIITNAKVHRNKRFVVNIDLENFFHSFHFGRVQGFFVKNKAFQFPYDVATVIAQLTCYQGHLPQGAPSSPIITNMICQVLDTRLLRIAKKYKLDYTRYADDLTFSTNYKMFHDNCSNFYSDLSEEISKAGFRINNSKTRLLYKDSKQKVTGLIVNQKINVDGNYYKTTRAMAHALYSNGIFNVDGEEGNINQLEGRFAFIDQLEKYNNKIDNKKHDCRHLSAREKQYQKFLFYKYFYANNTPLIVTEGKTDVSYIRSALKNLRNDYPDLITSSDSAFEFEIVFLNRTERLQYFLGICQDGADTLKNIYNFYRGINGVSNHNDYLQKMCGVLPCKPVILLLDNEIISKEKPLYKLVNHMNLDDKKKTALLKNLHINVTGNLYLLTTPLSGGKKESEIEDLFTPDTLSHKIAGKTFSRDVRPNEEKNYGKHIFSSYISRNYSSVDFSGFRPLLDGLNEIIKNYASHN